MKKLTRIICMIVVMGIVPVLSISTVDAQVQAGSGFFQTHSTWYEPIPDSPTLDPDSASYVARLAFIQSKLAYSANEFSTPIFYAVESDPLETIPLWECDDNPSDTSRCDRINHFGWNVDIPMPADAEAATGDPGGWVDGLMAIISPDGNTLWEFYFWDRPSWETNRVKVFDLTGDGIQQLPAPTYWPSPSGGYLNELDGAVSVSPVSKIHGMATYDEMVNGVINHALAFSAQPYESGGDQWTGTFWGTDKPPGVYPCYTDDGKHYSYTEDEFSPWLGHRFQLDPTLDINDPADWGGGKLLANGEKILATALQTYGMILIENGGNHSVALEDLEHDTGRSWSETAIELANGNSGWIKMSDFQLIVPLEAPFASQESQGSQPTAGGAFLPPNRNHPSYNEGYATCQAETLNENLWDGLAASYSPNLGITGAVLKDQSGNHINATVDGVEITEASWALDTGKRGFLFNEVNGSSLTTGVTLNDVAFTYAVWANPAAAPTQAGYMLYEGSENTRGLGRVLDKWEVYANLSSTNDVVYDTWSHVVYTHDGTTGKLYVNGVLEDSAVYALSAGGNLILGAYNTGSFAFKGILGDINIYDRAILPSEIQQLYIDPHALFRQKAQHVVIQAVEASTRRIMFISQYINKLISKYMYN